VAAVGAPSRLPPMSQPELRLLITARTRGPARLDDRGGAGRPDPSVDAVCEAAQGARRVVLGGGEPTLRPDLPGLLAALAEPGRELLLQTDALSLGDGRAARSLHEVGLCGVRVLLHCGRPDAHDWLTRTPGATRAAVRALRACAGVGLATEAAITVTRPTAPWLAETVALLARLGVQAVHLRRLAFRGAAADDFVALSPRLERIAPHLVEAVEAARRDGVALHLEGFPPCLLDRLPRARVPACHPWTSVGLGGAEAIEPDRVRCDRCDEHPGCAGIEPGYLALFGPLGPFEAAS
jgi:MoaA/NifB/PqqE/SkfB family radical SAM enzyme